MNLATALSVRTATEMRHVLSAIPDPETRENVYKAFAEADLKWKQNLVRMVGQKQADKVFSVLASEVPEP